MKGRTRKDKDQLTDACQAVLVGVLKGYSNLQIADKIGCSEATVRCHFYKVLEHYDLHSRAELISMYVCEYGLGHEIKQLEGSNYYGTI